MSRGSLGKIGHGPSVPLAVDSCKVFPHTNQCERQKGYYFEALAYILYVRERYHCSLVGCKHKKMDKS